MSKELQETGSSLLEKEENSSRLMDKVKESTLRVQKEPEDLAFVWPNLVYIEFICLLIASVILVLLSMGLSSSLNAPLEEMASPDTTPNPMKAPWYFLGLQELLVYFDPWIAGVVLPVLIILGLMAIPFIDPNPKGKGYYTFSERKIAVLTFLFGIGLWYILIVVGVWLRGLDWQWYWPWEDWTVHKPPGTVRLLDLEVLIQKYVGLDQVLSNLVTYVIIAGYYAVGFTIPFLLFRRFYKTLGFIRYSITMFFFLTMMGVPLKIFLRLVFNIKYVLVTPWFKI
jgi:Cytochrome b(C-terminal)/b6/petD